MPHPLETLRELLASREPAPAPPADVAPGPHVPAAVALLVRPADPGLEVLLIKRATHPLDPWSGHIALPGGRQDPGDESSLATAIRETREEVGIDLARVGMHLGRLDDVHPRRGAPSVVVSPFVFSVPQGTPARRSIEVDVPFWVGVADLRDPSAATEYLHALPEGREMRFPAIGYGEHVIWGLTHRILTEFFELAGGIIE